MMMKKNIIIPLSAALIVAAGFHFNMATSDYSCGEISSVATDGGYLIPMETLQMSTYSGVSGAVTDEVPGQSVAGQSEEKGGLRLIQPHETIVNSYAELKSALSEDNGITTVYFGGNIVMQGGIKINSKKLHVVIDGYNPLEPTQAVAYSLTDFSSASFYDTIYIDSVGTKTLLVRNLNITGKNYYGPFSILDSSALADISVTYEGVDYNGPQFGYHRKGTIHFKDCNVRIHGENGGSVNQEFSEVKRTIFEGENTIITATNNYCVFWHPTGGVFEIADDSSLMLISSDTSPIFGVFYADLSTYKTTVEIGKRAVFDAVISGVLAPDAYVTLSDFTVKEGGAFYLRASKSTQDYVLNIGGALIVEADAKFVVSGYGSASYSLVRQKTGDINVGKSAEFRITSDNPYASLLDLTGNALICDDPASVLLYNANRNIVSTSAPARIYVSAQQINYWKTLSPDSIDNPPLYKWKKADKTDFWIDGVLGTGSTGNFSALQSNYSAGDTPGEAPTSATFNMVDARVLSFGRIEIIAAQPSTQSKHISGVTRPNAVVRVSFTQQGTDYILPDVIADEKGIFSVPTGVTLDKGTTIKIICNWRYLTETAEVVVIDEGNLECFAPDTLEFYSTEIASSARIVKRLDPEWKITVSDTRGQGNGWKLYVRLEKGMTPDVAYADMLENALIFADAEGNISVINAATDTLILEHVSGEDEDVFPVIWDVDEGVLLFVRPGTAMAGVPYTALITWVLVDAP